MENVEIARNLTLVGDLLEIRGEDPFKVRAYRNAVRTIANLTRPLSEMVEAGEDLDELPGIGHDIAGYIEELVRSGHLGRLEELERHVPRTLVELLRIERIGPKRVHALFEELGIRTATDLEAALDSGTVAELKGFGPKTLAALRAGLRDLHGRPERFRLCDADELVRPLLAWMRGAPGLERLEVAGSYRRRAETVGDIDLLAVAARPGPVMDRFVACPDTAKVEAAGRTRGAIELTVGLHIDLRIVPERAFGSALHYLTGSKAHNIAVRRLAMEAGLRISEYGVFRLPKKPGSRPRRIAGAEEADVYAAVGMTWVPPELRENRGEIEASLADRLPRLVRLEDVRGDLQMHSTWSDGHQSIEAMAVAAADRGYEYLAITDHSRAVSVVGGLGPGDLSRQWKEITTVRRRLGGRIHLFRGVEVDILADGSLDLPDSCLGELDVVVASIHSHMRMSKRAQTDRVLKALSNPFVDILGHPTGRILEARAPMELDVEAVLQAAAELGVAVEIDAQPDRLDLGDVHIRRAKELGVKLVIDSDAHTTDALGVMRYGIDQARRGWLEKDDVLNAMPLVDLGEWLRERRRSRGGS